MSRNVSGTFIVVANQTDLSGQTGSNEASFNHELSVIRGKGKDKGKNRANEVDVQVNSVTASVSTPEAPGPLPPSRILGNLGMQLDDGLSSALCGTSDEGCTALSESTPRNQNNVV